jgi:hypothetical protein
MQALHHHAALAHEAGENRQRHFSIEAVRLVDFGTIKPESLPNNVRTETIRSGLPVTISVTTVSFALCLDGGRCGAQQPHTALPGHHTHFLFSIQIISFFIETILDRKYQR